MDTGDSIEIEQRPEWEACTVKGIKYDADPNEAVPEPVTILITPRGTRAWNPAFDVTPASLIDGIVTEIGVAEKAQGSASFDLRAFVKA